MQRLHVRRWDPTTVKPGRIVLLIGRRGSGKSTILRALMHAWHDRLDMGLAMSPTEETMDMFRQHLPEPAIFPEFAQSKVEDLVRTQRESMQKHKGRPPKELFLLLDDCMYDKSIMKSKVMRDIHMNGRHYHLSMAVAVQYCLDLPPDIRAQIDVVICCRELIISNKVKLWKYFFGAFDRYEDFSACLDKCTADYSALVLDNCAARGSGGIEQCLFWYRAPLELPPFRMGSPAFWKLAHRHVKSEAEREEEEDLRRELAAQQAAAARRKKTDRLVVRVTDEHGNPLRPASPLRM